MPRPDIRLTPDEQAAFLRQNRKCALATVDRDGFPHVIAMNFREKEGGYYMTSYGKAQKVLNIRRNPKVGIMVETGGGYAELKGVMVRGDCEIIEEAEAVAEVLHWLGEGRTTNARPGPGAAPQSASSEDHANKTFTWDHSSSAGDIEPRCRAGGA